MKHIIILVSFWGCLVYNAAAQVGVNTTNPDSTALLDINYSPGKTPVGVLFPNLVDSLRKAKKKVSDGMIVFDRERKMFYYFDTSLGTDGEWVAMNPFGSVHDNNNLNDIRPQDSEVNQLNMSLGLPVGEKATAKLDVNGNVMVRSDMRVDGSMKVNGSDTVQQNLIVKGNSTLEQTLQVNGVTTLQNPVTVNSTLTVNGNINAGSNTVAAKTFVGDGVVPIGGIIMWSGSAIPQGWALCDGKTNSGYTTPDLRGRFIVGYGANGNDSPTIPANVWDNAYANPGNLSEKGNTKGYASGEMKHTLTVPEMPSHNHTYDTRHVEGGSDSQTATGTESFPASIKGTTYSTGGSQAHENRPPYYVLAFIMRVQ